MKLLFADLTKHDSLELNFGLRSTNVVLNCLPVVDLDTTLGVNLANKRLLSQAKLY